MAYYYTNEKLEELRELMSSSMGIVKKNAAFDGSRNKTIVIGLGGMGRDTVRHLKENLGKKIGEIDGHYIQFRVFDTDAGPERDQLVNPGTGTLTETEFPKIDNSAVSATLRARDVMPVQFSKLMPPNFYVALNGSGSNQIRLAGGLTVMEKGILTDIYESVKQAITAFGDFFDSLLNIHIVAGSGGGCGSSLVVLMPYIVRAVVNNMHLPADRILNIYGHIYLPNVYEQQTNKELCFRNGCATLKEIDYYLNLGMNGETFEVHFPDPVGEVKSYKPIFDRCTLIGGFLSQAGVARDPKMQAIHVAVENLINQCTNVKGQVVNSQGEVSITEFFSDDAFKANEDAALAMVFNNEARFPATGNYHYDIIGSSCIQFPTPIVIDQFMGRMTEHISNILSDNSRKVTTEDIESFERNMKILPLDVIDEQEQQIRQKLNQFLSSNSISWTPDAIDSNAVAGELMNIVDSAVKAFDTDAMFVSNAVASASTLAKSIFTDDERGPAYLAVLLKSYADRHDTTSGIFERMEGYYTVIGNKAESYSLQTLEKNRASAASSLIGKTLLGGRTVVRKNIPAYRTSLIELYSAHFVTKLCAKLRNDYYNPKDSRSVTEKVRETLNHYLMLVDVFERINDIIKTNGRQAEEKMRELPNEPTSIFSIEDHVFDPLKGTISSFAEIEFNKMLEENEARAYISEFTRAMTSTRYGSWTLALTNTRYGTSEPCRAYRSFLADYCFGNNDNKGFKIRLNDGEVNKSIIEVSMIDFLNIAYNTYTRDQKSNVIRLILNKINYNAAPRFNVWEVPYFSFDYVSPLCYSYMVLPSCFKTSSAASSVNDDSWQAMFSTCFESLSTMRGLGKNTYWSPDMDTIYCFKMYTKMPLFIHSSICDYEESYWRIKSEGLHYNESVECLPSLYEYPSLIPVSEYFRTAQGALSYTTSDGAKPELEMMTRIRSVWDKAKTFGILTANDRSGEYKVRIIPKERKMGEEEITRRVKMFVEMNDLGDADFTAVKINMCDEVRKLCGGEVVRDILPARTVYATNDDSAVLLLRKQMKLFHELECEVKYFEEHVGAIIDSYIERVMYAKHVKLFAELLIRGLVFEGENGAMWLYNLEGERHVILMKRDYPLINGRFENPKLKYIEMEACKRMYTDNAFNSEHRAIFEKRMLELDDLILLKTDPQRADIERERVASGCVEVITRCKEVLSSIRGTELIDNEARDFYEEVIAYLNYYMPSLGIV